MRSAHFYFFLAIVAALSFLSCTPRDRYVVISGYAQGGTYAVRFNAADTDVKVEEIRDSIDSILGRIDRSLSGYNSSSLLSRFNRGELIVPDSLFIDIYAKSYDIFEQTGGCVDVSSAPLFDIWGFGFKSGSLPSEEEVSATLAACGMARLKRDMCQALDVDGCLGRSNLLSVPHGPAPELNYNAVAQGYSCDVVASYLYSIGVKDMMVDIGEIFCDGLNPSGRNWTIGIDRPYDGNDRPGESIQAVFKVPDGPHGVVTSGNYRKFYEKDGKKYAHTIDPRTGKPVTHNLLSATILAGNATDADAYATYCMVVGLDEAKIFVESHDDIEACLIYDAGNGFAVWTSDGFRLESQH